MLSVLLPLEDEELDDCETTIPMLPIPALIAASAHIEPAISLTSSSNTIVPHKNPTKTLNPDHNVCAVDKPHFCTATIATVPFITQTKAPRMPQEVNFNSVPNRSGRKDVRKQAKDL